MALTAAHYLGQLQALMPSGAAWPRDPVHVQTRTLAALAEELARVSARFDDLSGEADVRAADELLTDWERLLGLPDDCQAGLALSIADRRRITTQRLIEKGGQSTAYFLGLAELLGEPGCTITEFRPMNCNDDCNDALYSPEDRFNWRLTMPHAAVNARPMNCNDDCNDPLDLSSPSLIVCPITERKPAHTNVFFAYTA